MSNFENIVMSCPTTGILSLLVLTNHSNEGSYGHSNLNTVYSIPEQPQKEFLCLLGNKTFLCDQDTMINDWLCIGYLRFVSGQA